MSSKPKTTTQTSEPNSMQKPYFKGLYEDAFKAYQQNQGTGGYQGNFFAPPTQTQQDANQQVIAASGGLGQGGGQLRQLGMDQIAGKYLDPASNPFIAAVVNAGVKPIQDRLDSNLLNINDKAISQGAYGGSRQGLQELQALKDFNTTAGDMASQVYAQNYANERGIQQNSGGLLHQADLMALAGPSALAGAGAQQQSWNQQGLNNDQAKFQADQGGPWAGMDNFLKALTTGGFGSTTAVQENASNPLASAFQGLLGGGVTGANLGMGIGGLAATAGLGAFAPWMIPMALLGGLAGGLTG